eukprot:1928801-Prymnesium_polylepis.1
MAERDERRGTTVRGLDPRRSHGGGSERACGRQSTSGHADAAAPLGPGRRAGDGPRDVRHAARQSQARPRVAMQRKFLV